MHGVYNFSFVGIEKTMISLFQPPRIVAKRSKRSIDSRNCNSYRGADTTETQTTAFRQYPPASALLGAAHGTEGRDGSGRRPIFGLLRSTGKKGKK